MTIETSPYSVPGPRTGHLDPDMAGALAGLLDAPAPDDELPPFWHWVYLLDRPRQEDLGTDGHASSAPHADARTTRMFAGGRLTTHVPLRLGRPGHRASSVQQIRRTSGRSGELTFVTVRHEIIQDDALCLVDEQDLVYRSTSGPGGWGNSPGPSTDPARAERPGRSRITLQCDSVLLFRFSALTYNAHRIHYDLDYARSEGYPGLVVHGPLQVLLMSETVRRAGYGFTDTRFEYRLVAPAVAPCELTSSLDLCEDDEGPGTRVQTLDARTTATGRLVARPAS